MNSKIITAIGLLTSAALFSACGGSNAPANSTNTNAANNAAVANSNNPLAATTPTPEQTTNDAPTLTPVVRAYYDASRARTAAAMRKVLSKDFVQRMTEPGTKTLLMPGSPMTTCCCG